MEYQDSQDPEIEINTTEADYFLDSPHMAHTPHTHTPDTQIHPLPIPIPDPPPPQYPNHQVVQQFSLDTAQPSPIPYLYVEFYAKVLKPQEHYPFIISKTMNTNPDTSLIDHHFLDLVIKTGIRNITQTFPYSLFAKEDIDIRFKNPEVTFFYNQNKQVKLFRFSHPAPSHIQSSAPTPILQKNGTQPYVRMAIYLEVLTSPGKDKVIYQEDQRLIRPIIQAVLQAKKAWTSSPPTTSPITPAAKRSSTLPSTQHPRRDRHHPYIPAPRNSDDLRHQVLDKRDKRRHHH